MQQRWPGHLWIVRHGESAGNVARDAAMTAGLPRIDLDIRDVDVPLSPRGERQADALGRWFAAMPREQQPQVVLVSPYVRARDTAARPVRAPRHPRGRRRSARRHRSACRRAETSSRRSAANAA